MIDLTFNIATGTMKLAAPAVIKVTGSVPVRITFSEAPDTIADQALALASDASSPAVLAYTDTWSKENDTTWTATLDANDSRLIAFIAGKASVTVNAEFRATLNGDLQISPNVPVTVQATAITGPTSSEEGPVYYTAAQVDAAILAAIAALVAANEGLIDPNV